MDPIKIEGEIVEYDPKDPDTYPSVCLVASDVRERFGFVGGELLLFNNHGAYVARLDQMLEAPR